jgi:transposase
MAKKQQPNVSSGAGASPPPVAKSAPRAASDFAALVGFDWGDREHAVHVLVDELATGERGTSGKVGHTPEELHAWAAELRERFGGRPVAIAIEQSRGAVIAALTEHEHLVIYPINPKQAARYREALSVCAKKDDPFDARLLAIFLREHLALLRPLERDDALTRELGDTCQFRRKLVDDRTRLKQAAIAELKQFFPQALDWFGDLQSVTALDALKRWPTLHDLQRANPATLRKFFHDHRRRNEDAVNELIDTIRAAKPLTSDQALITPRAAYTGALLKQIAVLNQAIRDLEGVIDQLFSQHADAAIFQSLPGAGDALAPRLCAALGTNRERFDSAANVQAMCGIAPVTKASGQSRQVQRCHACPAFLRQTFHEFADRSRKGCAWARALYKHYRARGKKHHAAIRALAFKWIRIIFKMWKTKTCYDDSRYLHRLQLKNPDLAKTLASA